MQYQQFFAVRFDTGAALPYATVTVYISSTLTLANLFNNLGVPISNPTTADGIGQVGFAVADGKYDIQIASGAYTAPLIVGFQSFDGSMISEQLSSLQAGYFTYATLTELNADLAHGPNVGAQVVADGSNNGIYQKSGASGSGSWTKISNTSLDQKANETDLIAETARAEAAETTIFGVANGGRQIAPLIIMMGESNALGKGLNSAATAAELLPRPSVKIYNTTTRLFENLSIARNSGSGAINGDSLTQGIELELANQVEAGKWGASELYVVKTGQGGATAALWVSSGAYFSFMRDAVLRAMHLIRSMGKIPVPFIFYSQGINDQVLGVSGSAWQAATQVILQNTWDVLDGTCPVVMTQFNQAGFGAYNSNIAAIATIYPQVYAMSTTGFAIAPDGIHWNYDGLKHVANSFWSVLVGKEYSRVGTIVNRCPWDEDFRYGVPLYLTNNDYQVTNYNGPYLTILGAIGQNTGKLYIEFDNATTATNSAIGLAQRDVSLRVGTFIGNAGIGNSGGHAASALLSGSSHFSGTTSGTALSTALSQVSGQYNAMAVDFGAGKIWLSSNGTWNGDPVAGTNPWATFTVGAYLWYPAASPFNPESIILRGEATASAPSLNGNAGVIVGTPPSGYTPWGAHLSIFPPSAITAIAPYVYGQAIVGSTLYCEPGRWDGSPRIRLSYQWSKDGALIAGATNAFYVANAVAAYSCMVTATNGVGVAQAQTAALSVAATAAAGWDNGSASPLLAFSSSNTIATGTASAVAYQGVRGMTYRSTGKQYFEINVIHFQSEMVFGVGDDSFIAPDLLNIDPNSPPFRMATLGAVAGGIYANDFTHGAGTLSGAATGDVIGVAVDIGAQKMWIARNNTWVGSGNPATGANPTFTWTPIIPILPLALTYGSTGAAQLVTTSPTYTAPSGFSNWG